MRVGRKRVWRIAQDNISTDSTVWTFGVKTDALAEQLAAVLESCYLVIKPFVRELLL